MASKKIEWSDGALADLERILDYLNKGWGEVVVSRFKKKLSTRLDLLAIYPKIGRQSNRNSRYRKSVLIKQVSIIYSVSSSKIVLIRLFDNRQDPNRTV